MSTPGAYLLDTSIVLHLIRETHIGALIADEYGLRASTFRPLICEVTLGELEAFAHGRGWGERKREVLDELKRWLVAIDISDPTVMHAYAEISTLAKTNGWSIVSAKNDLWIAAATHASNGTLLTMDRKEFRPLRDGGHLSIAILDARSGRTMS